jgi:SNF2 family DNA or RNA helicase
MALNIEKALFCRDVYKLSLNVPGFNGNLYEFQKKDVGFLFFIQKALLANQTGLGKTAEIIALNCLQKHHRRLKGHVQVVPAQSLIQWYKEYRRFAPNLVVRLAMGKPSDRFSIYNSPFDALLVSYNTLWNDWQYVASLRYNSIGFDEASFFKNDDTKSFDIVTTLAKPAEWAIPITATPIQNCVTDLWSIYQTLNMPKLLGNKAYFMSRYTIQEKSTVYNRGRKVSHNKVIAYQNFDELKQRIAPFYVRRRVTDPEVDEALPELTHEQVWLDLLPEQRHAYDDVKQDTLSHGYKGRELRSKFHTMKKIIDGMQTLDDHNRDISVKSDKVMELLANDLMGDKVVIFSWYKANIRSLSERLKRARITHDFIWGDEPDKAVRFRTQERFSPDILYFLTFCTTLRAIFKLLAVYGGLALPMVLVLHYHWSASIRSRKKW